MKRSLFLFIAGLALLAGFFFFSNGSEEEAPDLQRSSPTATRSTVTVETKASTLQAIETTDAQRQPGREAPKVPQEITKPAVRNVVSQNAMGRLHGIVVLADGTPMADVPLRAHYLPTDPATKTTWRDTRSDSQGLFSFYLAAGNHRISFPAGTNFSPKENLVFHTGEDPIRLEMNALLVTFRNVTSSGEQTAMNMLQISSQWTTEFGSSPAENKTAGATKVEFLLPQEDHERLLSNEQRHVIRSTDPQGMTYFAVLDSGQPSGRISVDLLHDCPDFGSIVLHLDQPQLPEQATLQITSLLFDDNTCLVMNSPAGTQQGKIRLVVGGLLPGTYKLELTLEDAGFVALQKGRAELTVDAGGVHELHLKTSVGGILEIQVQSSIEVDPHSEVDLHYRKLGDREWAPLVTTSRGSWGEGDTSILTGNSAYVGAPASVTAPLPPGHYTIRGLLEGHAPREQDVQIVLSETLRIDWTLFPE